MSLSLRDKIFLLALYDLPVNVLFSQPSLVDGYVVTPCAESGSPIATRDGEHIPEVCDRPSYLKFDRFPLACLAVSLRQGGFRTIHHGDRLSLVVNNTPTLRYILPADAEAGFWIPRRLSDRKRFNSERMVRSRRHITMRPPAWMVTNVRMAHGVFGCAAISHPWLYPTSCLGPCLHGEAAIGDIPSCA